MLTVKFKKKRNSEFDVITGTKLVWIRITNRFVLYDKDNNVIWAMDPHYLEVTAVVTAPDN